MNIGLGGGIVSTYDVISSTESKEELDKTENSRMTGLYQIGHSSEQKKILVQNIDGEVYNNMARLDGMIEYHKSQREIAVKMNKEKKV